MAFKYDWTPGIFPLVIKIIAIPVLLLAVFSFFEEYPLWVPTSISVITTVIIVLIFYKLRLRK